MTASPSSKSRHRGRPFLLGAGLLIMIEAVTGCYRTTTPYRSSMNRAEEARRTGQFSEERRHFDEAARRATKPNDASEARYRSAQTWVRAGQHEAGALRLEKFALAYPQSARAARAWLDSGRAWEKAKEHEKALTAYRYVVSKYPESGISLGAAKRIVSIEVELRNRSAHEEWRQLLTSNRSSEFDEALRYHYARSLEEVSKRRALLAYQEVAQRHPLPRGTYADEALLRAAMLRRELLDPTGALETLDVLLGQGGPAAVLGSYTRTTYVEALLLKGLILRDDLNLPRRALKVFESLPKKHPQSRLVDDAVWQSIRTERTLGSDPCSRFQQLRELRPGSRYLRCEALLCSETMADKRHEKTCEEWLGTFP